MHFPQGHPATQTSLKRTSPGLQWGNGVVPCVRALGGVGRSQTSASTFSQPLVWLSPAPCASLLVSPNSNSSIKHLTQALLLEEQFLRNTPYLLAKVGQRSASGNASRMAEALIQASQHIRTELRKSHQCWSARRVSQKSSVGRARVLQEGQDIPLLRASSEWKTRFSKTYM